MPNETRLTDEQIIGIASSHVCSDGWMNRDQIVAFARTVEKAVVDRLEAELAAATVDAERYRWIRNKAETTYVEIAKPTVVITARDVESFDMQIDAARQAEAQGEKK
jgi:hypothetical protein